MQARPNFAMECSVTDQPYSPPSMSADQAAVALLRMFDNSSEIVERTRQAILAGERSEELFHELRVALKRLRSLYEVVARMDPEFSRGKRLRRLRPLFRAAGRVRDRQLHNKRLQGLMPPPDSGSSSEPSLPAPPPPDQVAAVERFVDVAAKSDTTNLFALAPPPPDEVAAVERFVDVAAKSDTTNLFALRNRIETALSPLSDKAMAPLIARAWMTMLDDIAGWERGEDRTDLHSLRILAKRAHHARFLIQSMFPQARVDQAAERHLDLVQKLLGTWHDDEVALEHLQSWTGNSVTADRARRELERAKTRLATSAMNEYRRLRTRILRNRRALISIGRA